MKQFFLTVLGVFAGMFLFLVVVPFIFITIAISSASSREPTPRNTVLELDLRAGVTDQAPNNPFAVFGGSGLSTLQIVDTLAQAEDDNRVKVLLLRLPEAGITPAAADEIRQAIRRFRASGKVVIAHSQGFMPVGTTVSSYMIGASASELWMQNTASFQLAGFSADGIFLGRAFDKYGVNAQFEQRYEYKNAVNEYNESDFTPAHREAMTAWMTSIYTSALANAAQDRRLAPAALRATIEAGPYSSAQALQRRLIDKIGQVEEAEAEARRRAGRNAEIMEFSDYASAQGPRTGSGRNAIAIVGGEGGIMTGTGGGGDPFGGGSSIMSDDLAEALYDAIEDDSVKAIVFRVSSPGGSPEASEQILAAVRAAKAAGKPVVVSMGDYAASGGYWISSEANWIVAQPSTLTGSIGVYGGKFVLAEALGRFGVDMRNLSVGGDYADAFSPSQDFTPAQRAAFAAQIDRTYEEFIARVAAGRRLPPARVREIARGRVWTGAQAMQIGLVDQLGGLEEAIAKARELARIPAGDSVRFQRYPESQSPFEALSEAFGVSGEAARVLVGIGGIMNDPAAEATVRRIQTERARASGASVLADQPY
ncbi:MAG: signal peptide peptidase SppA [Alphaproteobacteria bacterium]|nr:signal peptide peptidase SppA [Alphaproteobacteria bacterium]MBU2042192.1 signal peptide peptidase SppA [Alphaproteobacteria bacterium]MBU2125624.1 signal peptide peptidase SppA [Alphaproteobacteria bacterium]MBU2208383.1 signal peptide peptidase SppA [Alphaproteobacteria bacterium]MBU2290346.1 signal peptide peptidase SppA [Alphaproteobacteria bacterium]